MYAAKQKSIPYDRESALDFAIAVVAASAGGVPALQALLSQICTPLAAPILIVVHRPVDYHSHLAHLLGLRTPSRVTEAIHDEIALPGRIYLAPPGSHLMVGPDARLALVNSPRVNFCRPAADVTFTSAAVSFGPRAIAIVLSGSGADGAMGARRIRETGGFVFAQSLITAEYPSMPTAAIEMANADLILSPKQIGAGLCELLGFIDVD